LKLWYEVLPVGFLVLPPPKNVGFLVLPRGIFGITSWDFWYYPWEIWHYPVGILVLPCGKFGTTPWEFWYYLSNLTSEIVGRVK